MTKSFPCLFFFLLTLSAAENSFCQNSFQRLYGGVNQDISLVAIPCPSGGFYYLGATTSAGNGEADPVLMKLDNDGQVLWARTIGGPNYDVAGAMTLAADGGLVCAGSTKSYNGNTPDDLYFFKTDSLGSMQWSKTFSIGDLDVASSVIRTADDGFAITGFTRTSGLKRVLLIRTDSNGDTLFTRTYGGIDDQGVDLAETANGGFIITGKTFTQSLGESDILLMRTDAQGNLIWAKSFGELYWDEGAGIIPLLDDNYLISGSTISFGQGDFDILLLKTDTTGNIIWGKAYGGVKSDASYTAHENPDGSIVVSGYTSSMGYGHNLRMRRTESGKMDFNNPDLNLQSSIFNVQYKDRGDDSTNVFLMKVDAGGDTLWTRTYGDGAQDEALHFSTLPDGGYLIPGYSTSYTNTTDSTQMMLIRTDSIGHSGCHEQDAHPFIDSTNFIVQTLVFTQTAGFTENIVASNSLAWNLIAEDACLYIEVAENYADGLVVFPNPASNKLAISSRHPDGYLDAINTIEIYNTLGVIIWTVQLPPDGPRDAIPIAIGSQLPIEADVSHLPSGLYFLKLTTTSSSEITKKILIQKY